MNKIYLSGNYVMVQRNGTVASAFPARDTTYLRNSADDGYIIIYRGTRRASILDSEITAGDWEDDSAVLWDAATILTFLRGNTSNFNSASGGSGATYRAVIGLDSDGESMTNTVLFSNFPAPITVEQLAIGNAMIDLNNANPVIPQVVYTNGMLSDDSGKLWRFIIRTDLGISMFFDTQSSVDNGVTWVADDYSVGVNPQNPALLFVEYYAPVG